MASTTKQIRFLKIIIYNVVWKKFFTLSFISMKWSSPEKENNINYLGLSTLQLLFIHMYTCSLLGNYISTVKTLIR